MQVGLTFDEYQKRAAETAVYPEIWVQTGGLDPTVATYLYPTIGLCGEAGELAEKIKKAVRDRHGALSVEDLVGIRKELGDVLWYLSALTSEFGMDLSEIAAENLEKLASRKARGFLHGSGDAR